MKSTLLIQRKSAGKTSSFPEPFFNRTKELETFFQAKNTGNMFLQNSPTPFLNQESVADKLPEEVAGKMGRSLGADFSDVKVHLNSEKAQKLNAIAFTQGNEIDFAPGQYNPGSLPGQELIGHELIHVLQQRNGKVKTETSNKGLQIANEARFENEADHFGQMAARGLKVSAKENFNQMNQTAIQRKPGKEDSGNADTVADVADKTNASTNIIGGIIDHFNKNYLEAEKIANQALEEAAAAKSIALKKAREAQIAISKAGSGKSRILSGIASKAAREANEAKKFAAMKQAKALRFVNQSKQLKAILPIAIKVLNKLPLDKIGFAAAFLNKYLTTTNVTTPGKIADSTITAGFDFAFGNAHPIVSAIDALIGLIPGGERVNISNTMGNSITSITGSTEAIVTGDISGIEKFYNDSKEGKNTWIFEKAFEAGDFWSEHGGADRAQMVGDFWGGADTVTGRSTGFLAAMPGIGHAGEGLGWLAFQGYDKGGDALNYVGNKLSDADEAVMPEGRTLNPITGIKSILNWENPFW